jgi:hypothetical protein
MIAHAGSPPSHTLATFFLLIPLDVIFLEKATKISIDSLIDSNQGFSHEQTKNQ